MFRRVSADRDVFDSKACIPEAGRRLAAATHARFFHRANMEYASNGLLGCEGASRCQASDLQCPTLIRPQPVDRLARQI